MRTLRNVISALVAVLAASSCSDSRSLTEPSPATGTGFLASIAARRSSAETPVYISLRPGVLPDGQTAYVQTRDGAYATVDMVDGGFDPVSIIAAVGDTVFVSVKMAHGAPPASYAVVITKPSKPVIVRTSPTKSKRDVPLNSAVRVVFSEPLDPASLSTGTLRLTKGGVSVPGHVAFVDSTHVAADFTPDAPLESQSSYEIRLTSGIRDVDGMALDPVTVSFTTAVGMLVFSAQPVVVVDSSLPHFSRVRIVTRVSVRNSSGAVVTGYTGRVTLSLASHPAGGRLWIDSTAIAVDGVADFPELKFSAIGRGHVLIATAEGVGSAESFPFDAGGTLHFTSAPIRAFAGMTIPPVGIQAMDAGNSPCQEFQGALYLTAQAERTLPLFGTTQVAAVRGQSVFTELRIDEEANNVRFVVISDSVSTLVSAPFDVVMPRLEFSAYPVTIVPGEAIPDVVVTALDPEERPIAAFNKDVTLSVSTGGTLTGTRTVRAVNGVARFSNLILSGTDSSYSMDATVVCCATPAHGAAITAANIRLAFLTGPTTTPEGAPITPAIRVGVRDLAGNPLPNYQGTVTLSLQPGGPTQVLSGASSVSAIGGVATFANVSIGVGAPGYVLRASAAGAPDIVSGTFDVISPWIARAPLPSPRWGAGVVAINGMLYAVSGYNSNNQSPNLDVMDVYDPATDRWTSKAPMPTRRAGFGVAVVNGILYAIGGYDNGGVLATVEAYNPATNVWTSRAPMPTARSGAIIGTLNGIIYAIGSDNAYDTPGTMVEAYDPATNTWRSAARLITPRVDGAASALGGRLYVTGGYDWTGNDYEPQAVEVYDPATDRWTSAPWMSRPHSSHASVVVGDELYVIGGTATDGGSNVESYNTTRGTWVPRPAYPSGPYRVGAAVIDGVIHVVGGINWSVNLIGVADHYIYTPPPATTPSLVQAAATIQRK